MECEVCNTNEGVQKHVVKDSKESNKVIWSGYYCANCWRYCIDFVQQSIRDTWLEFLEDQADILLTGIGEEAKPL